MSETFTANIAAMTGGVWTLTPKLRWLNGVLQQASQEITTGRLRWDDVPTHTDAPLPSPPITEDHP